MGKIFGGSKSKSKSSNRAYDTINQNFSGLFPYATEGASALSSLLGGDASGFESYKDAVGFDPQAEYGSRGITGNMAARGLLRSGSTGKALTEYGNMIQNQFANQYLSQNLGLAGLGLDAGRLLVGAGGESTNTSKSKPGIAKFIGQAASSAAASDRRLKTNITKIGQFDNGLNIYEYNYINGSGPHVGVMADEVEKILPDAMGPEISGYKTVDYAKVREAVL